MKGILKLFQGNSAVENRFLRLDKHLLKADGLSVGNSQPVLCHFFKLLCSPKAALQSIIPLPMTYLELNQSLTAKLKYTLTVCCFPFLYL